MSLDVGRIVCVSLSRSAVNFILSRGLLAGRPAALSSVTSLGPQEGCYEVRHSPEYVLDMCVEIDLGVLIPCDMAISSWQFVLFVQLLSVQDISIKSQPSVG